MYDDFAGPGNWELFPEVIPALEKIKAAGAVLGVISNFDERLSKRFMLCNTITSLYHLGKDSQERVSALNNVA